MALEVHGTSAEYTSELFDFYWNATNKFGLKTERIKSMSYV